jgi:hypothetical protein
VLITELKSKLFHGSKNLNQRLAGIQGKSFEMDARAFLNELNCGLGPKAKVFSFPCISAKVKKNAGKRCSIKKSINI